MDESDNQKRDLTESLEALVRGSDSAVDRLLPAMYDELRSLAGGLLLGERPGHTLSATALVHEAYLRLVGQDRARWKGRAQLLAVAAQVSRRVLVDHARWRFAKTWLRRRLSSGDTSAG